MLKPLALLVTLASLSSGFAQHTAAAGLSDQWYAGAGATQAQLKPDAEATGVSVEENMGEGATLFFGRDFDDRSSGQLQLYALGDALFNDGNIATYSAVDASLLYRFYDSRDNRRNARFGVSIYGRFGIGFIDRESSTPLDTEGSSAVYFGGGAGLEAYLSDMFALRSEILFHEEDTVSANVSLVTRFGGKRNRKANFIPPAIPNVETNTRAPQVIDQRPPSYDSEPQAVPITGSGRTQQNTQFSYPSASTSSPRRTIDPNKIPYREDYRKNVNTAALDPNSNDYREDYRNNLIEEARLAAAHEYRAGYQHLGELESDKTSSSEYNGGYRREVDRIADTGFATTTQTQRDSDNDGVIDSFDQCNRSNRNYPVTQNGCSVLEQIGPEIKFAENSAVVSRTTERVLQSLATKLTRFPNTRIEMIAHTDNAGDLRVKASLARQRLRVIGTYLTQQGITQDRILLRSFGSSRPAYANTTATGRKANNRIEIIEKP